MSYSDPVSNKPNAGRPAALASGSLLKPATLALLAGVAPIVVVHICYALSVQAASVPLCMPYFEGCTSISRAARHGLANHVFKAVMLPTAALIAVFWCVAAAWLQIRAQPRARRIAVMRGIGVIGALFLILYAAFLGADGEVYRWMRRYGVTVYFSFTVLAQMLLASVLPKSGLRQALIASCGSMLLLGLASLPLQHFVADRDALLNAIEWCYALLMSSGFVFIGIAWWRADLRLQASARDQASLP